MKALKLEDEKGYKKKTLKVIVMTRASQKEKGYRKDHLSAMGFHGGTQYAEVNEFSP